MQNRFTGLWRHADFMRLWAGQSISVFGSMIGNAAMSFTAILFLQATPVQLGLLSAARLVPGFLTGLVAGAWVDRLRRRPIMIIADIGRAVVLATIPIAAILGVLHIEQLYLVTFLVSILTIFFDVAYQSYLPTLISRTELVEGNSKLAASASVAEVSGFGLAGWLVQIFTAPIAILIDAISFAVSAISVWLIRVPEQKIIHEDQLDMRREIIDGLRVVLHHPLLRATTAATLSMEFFGGMYGTLVVLYMSRGLGFEPGILGSIWAVGGISSLFGALLTERLIRRFGIGPSMIAGLALSALSMFFIPLAQGATLISILLLILPQITGDGAATMYTINETSLRQAIAPERMLGRVNASAKFVGLGATLLGALLGGWSGDWIGVRTTLFISAFGTLLSVLWLVLSPVRALKVVPEALLSSPTAAPLLGDE